MSQDKGPVLSLYGIDLMNYLVDDLKVIEKLSGNIRGLLSHWAAVPCLYECLSQSLLLPTFQVTSTETSLAKIRLHTVVV